MYCFASMIYYLKTYHSITIYLIFVSFNFQFLYLQHLLNFMILDFMLFTFFVTLTRGLWDTSYTPEPLTLNKFFSGLIPKTRGQRIQAFPYTDYRLGSSRLYSCQNCFPFLHYHTWKIVLWQNLLFLVHFTFYQQTFEDIFF